MLFHSLQHRGAQTRKSSSPYPTFNPAPAYKPIDGELTTIGKTHVFLDTMTPSVPDSTSEAVFEGLK